MDKSVSEVIQALSDKLGTTSEYLWSALLKQAPIDGVASLVGLAIWFALLWLAWMYIKRMEEINDIESSDDARARKAAATVAWFVVVGLSVLALISSSGTIIAAFFNQEYWALQFVMGQL